MSQDIWTSREGVASLADEMVGFQVEGRDGSIGKIDHVSYGGTCLIVATGRILGHKYVVPASQIQEVDLDTETVIVDLTKDEIEASPEYDSSAGFDDDCEAKVGEYYTGLASRRSIPQ